MEHSLRHHRAPEPGGEAPIRRQTRFRGFSLVESDDALLQLLEMPHREILTTDGSYEQISRALNIPPGTVRSRLHRARVALTTLREQQTKTGT